MISLRDEIIKDIKQFLDQCESKKALVAPTNSIDTSAFCATGFGRDIPTMVEQPLQQEELHAGKCTVTYEARLLKALFMRLV